MNNELINQLAIWQVALPLGVIFVSALLQLATFAAGLRTTGISPADPALHAICGTQVLAPCTGTVLHTIDGVPANPVPEMNRDAMTGNSVILDCKELAVALAHFIPGSLTVTEGEVVEIGQEIAEVGNSGNSGEPHLHVRVQEGAPRDQPLSGDRL